ncbi:membrane metallo-endopeptidase-like 1 isoform X2 [Ornithodoros turicata]
MAERRTSRLPTGGVTEPSGKVHKNDNSNRRQIESVEPPASLTPMAPNEGPSTGMRIALSSVAIIVVVILLVNFMMGVASPSFAKKSNVCRSKSCQAYADLFSDTIDWNVRPCENFYQHVCGRRDSNLYFTVHQTTLKSFVQLLSESLLSTFVPKEQQNATQLAAKMYQSCQNVSVGDQGEVQQLKAVLKNARLQWPERSIKAELLFSMMYISYNYHCPALIDFNMNTSGNVPVLSLLNPFRTFHTWSPVKWWNRTVKERERYRLFYKEVTMYFTNSAGIVPFNEIEKVDRAVAELVANRTPLADDSLSVTGPMDITEFLRIFPSLSPKLLEAVGVVYGTTSGSKTLISYHEGAVEAFQDLLRLFGEDQLHQYVAWVLVHTYPSALMYRLLSRYAAYPWGYEDIDKLYCFERVETFLGSAMIINAMEKIETPEAREDIIMVVNSIRKAAQITPRHHVRFTIVDEKLTKLYWIQSFRNSVNFLTNAYAGYRAMGPYLPFNWLTAVHGYAKNSAKTFTEAFPSYFHRYYNTSRYDTYSFSPPWDPSGSDDIYLTIKPHHFLVPTYGSNATTGLLYGSLGSLIAKMFADDYVKVRNASYQTSWSEMVPSLNCSPSGEPRYVDGLLLTLWSYQEFLWNAFQKASAGRQYALPGFLNYTNDMIFFVAQCYLLCGSFRSVDAINYCNEPLKRNIHFAKVFQCPTPSPMNVVDKCDMRPQ